MGSHPVKVLRLRMVLGGIYELKEHFAPCVQQVLVECAILGCIRNSPEHVKIMVKKESQIKQYLSFLGIGYETNEDKSKSLVVESFYDKERKWMNNLKQTL